jgi:hypothetical protein
LGVDLTIFQEIVTAITDLVDDASLQAAPDAPVNANNRRKRVAGSLAMGQLMGNTSSKIYLNFSHFVSYQLDFL